MFRKKITTLSFEGSEIRCLTARGKEVTSWRSIPVAPEMMDRGVIHDPAAVGRTIDKILTTVKASKRNLVTCVTDQRTVHRIMAIPVIKENLLEEAIRRKAKQEFAIPIENTDLSWRIIREANNQYYLYVLAVPKIVIDRQMEALQETGLKPKLMDAKPLAVLRAVDRESALIVNLEPHSMAVYIIVNQIPVIVRTIPLDSGEISKEAKLDLLSQELARTTKYYNETNKKNRLPEKTPLFLTGKLFDAPALEDRLSNFTSLADRLQQKTAYPVQLPQPPLDYPEELPLAEFTVNLGLVRKISS